jgi:hypothetical protein
MSKLAYHIALFCSHDNTAYLVKYIDSVPGLDQNWFSPWTGSKLIHLRLSSNLFVWDVISNPPIRTGLHSKSSHFDPVFGFASDLIKLRGSGASWVPCFRGGGGGGGGKGSIFPTNTIFSDINNIWNHIELNIDYSINLYWENVNWDRY